VLAPVYRPKAEFYIRATIKNYTNIQLMTRLAIKEIVMVWRILRTRIYPAFKRETTCSFVSVNSNPVTAIVDVVVNIPSSG